MITKAKYEKAVDDAFGTHVGTAFNVLLQSITGARPETKEIAVRKFGETVRVCIEAHAIALEAAPENLQKK